MDLNKHGLYYRQCVAIVNHIETNPHTRIASWYIWLDSDLWSNLLRKSEMTATFYFPADEQSVCIRKIYVSVNSMGCNHDASFL